ncbi:MAG: sulfatase-like hydrolase/transferase [Akkermansiaceae bacterium]|nr:sulfatase-like hydrolase/transferase [Akkermansiaceae bacterium]
MNRTSCFLLLLASAIPSARAAIIPGQTIGIDFGTTAPVPSANFNAYTDVVIANGATESFSGTLVDTAGGSVTGVGFSVTNRSGQDTGRATGNNGSQGAGLMTDSTIYSDWIISNDADGARLTGGDTVIDGSGDRGHLVLTFTGLDDSLSYNLTGGFDNNNANFNAIWQADGQTFTTDASGVGYGTLSGLNTDGSGNLVIHVIRPGNTNGQHVTVAGLTLEAVAATAPAIALGDVIRVDFGTTTPNGNYNVIHGSQLSITDLVRFSDGAAVDVDLTVTATTPFDNGGNVASTAGLSHIDASDADVYADGLLSTGGDNGAGNDTITLTFTGLDDSLYYDLSGGIARSSNGSNFSTTWTSSSGESQVADGTAAGGYIDLKSLTSSGGTLTVTLTDNVRQSGVAQLALVATDTPPPSAQGPALPDGVTVYFKPTQADGVVTKTDLDNMTVGGTWDTSLATVSQFGADTADGFRFAMDGALAQGDYVELAIDDGGLDFTSNEVSIDFQMLATRASAAGDKHLTLIGYDGTDEVFRLKYESNPDNALNTITVTTGDGDESMGFTPLRWIADSSIPSGLQDFRIVLSNGQVSFSGSSLTPQDGPVLNAAQTLTSLRWEISGSNTGNQGFWLDDLQIRDGLPSSPRAATDRPNVIFILMDDMGYSDVSCYGATKVDTPNIDSLASGGLKFTTFLLPSNVCSPSRAAFLTGAYPSRCGIPMAVNHPNQNHWFLGLDPDEITIAEQCRKKGYKTFMVGKWHLGVEEIFLPHNQGFDHFFGTWGNGGELFDETEVAHASFPENTLTSMYTQRIREHIRNNRDKPFFIYYPHNYPHTPYTEGNAFDGATGNGTRSDVIKEVDWSVGQIVAELKANGILENTLIVFTSDNGAVPPDSYANAPFKGSKYVTWEGGHRVPFIMYWKGQVLTPAQLASPQVWAMDLFPTIAELVGEPLDAGRVYDGTSLVPLLTDQPIARAADAPFYYYSGDNLQCVRKGDWKLHLPRTEYQLPWWDQIKPPPSSYSLYDLSSDPGETTDVAASNQAIVDELTALAEAIRLELGDADPVNGSLVMGTGQRGTGTLFSEVPTIVNLDSDYGYVPDWNSLSDAEKGRGLTRMGAGSVVNTASDFINGSTLPHGWQYLNASEATGGAEVAMTAGSTVGTQGNTGFAGTGTAGLIGSVSAGSYVIDSANSGNAGTAGTDMLIATDGDTARDFVIVRYTIDENDVSFGKTRAKISGSFRDLVGGTTDDSVVVYVFHNNTQLFNATGANGRLLEADGTFNITDLAVAANDTISFVIGSNGDATGDEVALKSSIQFERESTPRNLSLGMDSASSLSGGNATLRLNGTPGLSYIVERSYNLMDWTVIENIPFLPSSSYDVFVDASGDRSFWRIRWAE